MQEACKDDIRVGAIFVSRCGNSTAKVLEIRRETITYRKRSSTDQNNWEFSYFIDTFLSIYPYLHELSDMMVLIQETEHESNSW